MYRSRIAAKKEVHMSSNSSDIRTNKLVFTALMTCLVLLGTIGKNIELIALLKISIERLEQQLEILMEKRLYRDIKTNNTAIGYRRTVTKLDAAELFGQRHKLRTCDKRHTFLETCRKERNAGETART